MEPELDRVVIAVRQQGTCALCNKMHHDGEQCNRKVYVTFGLTRKVYRVHQACIDQAGSDLASILVNGPKKFKPGQSVQFTTVQIAFPTDVEAAAVVNEIHRLLGDNGSNNVHSPVLDWRYLQAGDVVPPPYQVTLGDDPDGDEAFGLLDNL